MKQNILEDRLRILCQRPVNNKPVELILQNTSRCLQKRIYKQF